MKVQYLIDAWLVLLLAVCFGAALAGVQMALADRIAANEKNKTLSRIPQLIPGADPTKIIERTLDGETVYQVRNRAGEPVGWAVTAVGDGYADKIRLLIGLSPDASALTGIDVLSQKETPALGDNITTADFRQQFAGKPTDDPLKVDQDGGGIEALTAATISSRSVCDIVNKAVARWKPRLGVQ